MGGARHGRVLRESEDYAVTRHSISLEQEPYFLTREQIDTIHRDQIEAWGGLDGLRSESALESAIAAISSIQAVSYWRRGLRSGSLVSWPSAPQQRPRCLQARRYAT